MSKTQHSATADVTVRLLSVESIELDASYATRKSGHDEAGIERIAKSYMYRAQNGIQPVQMNDLIVTPKDGSDDTFILMDGEGRYRAAVMVNDMGGIDGEPMQLRCKIVRSTDHKTALVTGLQANFHDPIDVFDQADVAAKLIETGMKQREVATVLNVTEGRISQILSLNKVAKKYVQAYRDGDLEQDAVIAIANMDADDATRQEVMEEAMRHREKINGILARREHKAKKAELDTQLAEAKSRADELAQQAKEAEKRRRELDKAQAATKDEKELKKVREELAEADKALKDTEKELRKATKDIEKTKEAKAKLAENPPTKKAKATAEDVKQAAKEKGVKGTEKQKTAVTKATFYAEIEAIGSDEKNPVPDSVKMLIGRIEGFLDGEYTVKQLRNAFVLACRNDDEYKRASAKK